MADTRLQILIDLQTGASASALADLRKEIADLAVALKKDQKAADDTAKAFKKTEEESKKASKGVKVLRTSLRVLRKTADLAVRAMKGFGNAIRRLLRSVFSLKGALVGLGLGLVAKSFIDAGSAAENFRVRLDRVLRSATEGGKVFEDMAEFASKVPFEFREIVEAATSLAGVMREGRDDINKYIPVIADLAAVSGLTIQETTGQVIRMYSAGAAAADLFRERGINAMLGFQAGVSYSAEETQRRLIAAFEDPQSRFRGAAESLGDTWTGLMSMLSDAWFQFRTAVVNAGLFDFLKTGIKGLLDEINRLREEGTLDQWAKNISDAIIGSIKTMIRFAGVAFDTVARIIGTVADLLLEITETAFHLRDVFKGATQQVQDAQEIIGDEKHIERNRKKQEELEAELKSVNKALAESTLNWDENKKKQMELQRELQETRATIASVESTLVVSSDAEFQSILARERSMASLRELAETMKGTTLGAELQAKALELLEKKTGDLTEEEKAAAKAQQERIDAAAAEAKEKEKLAAALVAEKKARDDARKAAEEEMKERHAMRQLFADLEVEAAEGTTARILATKAREVNSLRAAGERRLAQLQELRDKELIAEEEHRQRILMVAQAMENELDRIAAEGAARRAGGRRDAALFTAELRVDAAPEGDTQTADDLANLQVEQRYQERLDRIKEMRDAGFIEEQAAVEAQNLALAAKANELADIEAAARQRVFDATAQTLANAESAFGDLYEATGKKAKGFFYAQKAVSIALTLMKTYEAAQAAYSSAVAIPTVGPYLAPVMAALAVAQGLARVALIRQQSLAAGGEVLGHSPTSTADNIPINATAGEFVQPVSAVRYYGAGLMEAIRTKAIPRGALSGYAAPTPPPSHRFAFQAGGAVGASDRATARVAESEQQPIIINNVRDPNEAEQLIQSQPGQRSVWNVIASDPYRLNRILQQGR